jgi:hypothetical protein
MKFHWPSFVLGWGVGLATVQLSRHLRPVLLEASTAAYHIVDELVARAVMLREDAEDLLAEARARARGALGREPAPSVH